MHADDSSDRRLTARTPRVRARKLILAAATATLVLATAPGAASAAPKAAGDGTAVCNEAENSHRGGYTVSGGSVDPNPPAFLRGAPMRGGARGGGRLGHPAPAPPAPPPCRSTGR